MTKIFPLPYTKNYDTLSPDKISKKEKIMGKILNFFKKRSTLLTLGLFVLFTVAMPADVWAQAGNNNLTGPFHAFLLRAAKLFMQTRYALYTIAAFSFVAYAWTAIQDGKVDWGKMFYLIVGLVILGVAGWTVSYLADPQEDGNKILDVYQDFNNTTGWDD